MATIVEIPKRHKAAVYENPGTNSIKVTEVDTPEPGTGEVLIRLTHSGVCHSDFGVMMNTWDMLPFPTPQGQVGGHEGVGSVAKLGPGCEKYGVKVGDRVGIKWLSNICNNCAPCRESNDGGCTRPTVSGYFTPGTYQQYALGPADYVTPIPDGLSSAEAAPMLCAGVTTYAALKRSGARAGQWVVISGAGGGLGHIACQLASKGFGFRVIGVDAGSKKRDLVLHSGAEHYIDVMEYSEDAAVGKAVCDLTTGGKEDPAGGAKAAIVCTSNNRAYAQAMLMLGYNGTLVCVGMPEGKPVPIGNCYPMVMVKKMLNITAAAVGNRQDAIEVLEWASRGIARAECRLEKMDGLQAVFDEMSNGTLQGRVVLDLE